MKIAFETQFFKSVFFAIMFTNYFKTQNGLDLL